MDFLAVAALMGMKREMRDENHVLDGWDINSVDPCTWYMVGCSPESFVISLWVFFYTLKNFHVCVFVFAHSCFICWLEKCLVWDYLAHYHRVLAT